MQVQRECSSLSFSFAHSLLLFLLTEVMSYCSPLRSGQAMAALPFCSPSPPRFASSSSLAMPAASLPIMATAHPVVDKAIIVGGGLGGLSAALQLRHIGIDAQVCPLSFISFSFSVLA